MDIGERVVDFIDKNQEQRDAAARLRERDGEQRVAAARSQWARGLLDARDERLIALDLRATAISGGVLILLVLGGFVVDIARGGDGSPYAWLAAVAGVTYLVSLFVLSRRS